MKIIGIITGLFMLVYLVINKSSPLFLNLSNGSFLLSLIYLMIAMIVYVRNIGLFKTFAYNSYKRTVRKNIEKEKASSPEKPKLKEQINEKVEGIDPRNTDMLEFHEFCEKKYGVQWSNKKYLISALIMFVLSEIFFKLI